MKIKVFSVFCYWLLAFLWSGLIFYLSSIPGLESGLNPPNDFILRKLAHLTEYGILAILWFKAFIISGVNHRRSFWFCIIFCIIFAISDEIHQFYVPNREGRVYDVFIDILGTLIGTAVFLKFWKPNIKPMSLN